jgi:hypothetical protein
LKTERLGVSAYQSILGRMSFEENFLSAKLPLCALAFLTVSAPPSFAQDVLSDAIELHFGATTVVLDRNSVLGVGGLGKFNLGNAQKFDISPDGPVTVALPPQVLISFSPPCEPITEILMLHGTVPPITRQPLFSGYRPTSTKIGGVSRLEPSSGHSILELYRFDSDDLRDFWGEQITFYRSAPLIQIGIQFTRDMRVRLAISARQCFFERGETFMRQLRSFVLSTVK